MAAQLAHELGSKERVRAQIPEALHSSFDLAFAVQEFKLAQEGHEKDVRVKQRAEEHVLEASARRTAADEIRRRERDALLDGDADADIFGDAVMTSADLDGIPEPEPLIDGFLNKSSVVRIYGPPKSYKSFIMLDMAGCIATGIKWHGNDTSQAKCLYVVAEGVRGFRRRVRAWECVNKRTMDNVDFYPKAVQIGSNDELRGLIAFAKQGGHQLIVFDTQARCTVGKEENSNTEMGVIVAALDVLKEATGACVSLVHHSGNNGGRARGASAILGALDAEFEVEADKDVSSAKLWTRAQKDMEEARAVEFDLVTPAPGLALAVKPRLDWYKQQAADMERLPDGQELPLKALAEFGGAGATLTNVVGEMGPGTNAGNVRKSLGQLLRKGYARQQGSTWRIDRSGQEYLDSMALRDRIADS